MGGSCWRVLSDSDPKFWLLCIDSLGTVTEAVSWCKRISIERLIQNITPNALSLGCNILLYSHLNLHVHPLLPDTFRCGTNTTRHPTATDPGQLPPSSFHRVHYVLPDQKERCVGQENRSEMGSSCCWWEGAGAGCVQVFLLGSGVLPLMPRAWM